VGPGQPVSQGDKRREKPRRKACWHAMFDIWEEMCLNNGVSNGAGLDQNGLIQCSLTKESDMSEKTATAKRILSSAITVQVTLRVTKINENGTLCGLEAIKVQSDKAELKDLIRIVPGQPLATGACYLKFDGKLDANGNLPGGIKLLPEAAKVEKKKFF
jgi:hypothetical protein